jgi:hypothetical protein
VRSRALFPSDYTVSEPRAGRRVPRFQPLRGTSLTPGLGRLFGKPAEGPPSSAAATDLARSLGPEDLAPNSFHGRAQSHAWPLALVVSGLLALVDVCLRPDLRYAIVLAKQLERLCVKEVVGSRRRPFQRIITFRAVSGT